MKYRKEIDGLRAIAILPVIFFHSGSNLFSGGYIGVDIFFVISGFLITSIIIEESNRGGFSLIYFYQRRARRILPALFFMIICIIPAAWILMLPADLREFSQSLVAVPLFASNILFYLKSGYFDIGTDLKPLLHTWSLAVEEQFYIVFPLFFIVTRKLNRGLVIAILAFAVIVGILTAQYYVDVNENFSFYLLPTRGWEILIGALIAMLVSDELMKNSFTKFHQIASIVGLFLISYSILFFNEKTPWPSVYTLIPVIGSALILVFATNETWAAKFLSSKPLVTVGVISYSAYLWHQPLFAFARLKVVDVDKLDILLTILTVCTFGLAYLSWRYIEEPFRKKLIFKNNKNIYFVLLVVGLMLIIIGLYGYKSNGGLGRYSGDRKIILGFQFYNYENVLRRHTCFMEPENTYLDFKKECFGVGSNSASLIWGDSYAAASSYGLRQSRTDVIQLTASACPPVIDTQFIKRPQCNSINNFVKEKIGQLKPAIIYLQANWVDYRKENAVESLSKTLEFIKKISPKSKIIIVGSTPIWDPTLPVFLFRNRLELEGDTYVEMPKYRELKLIDKKLKSLADVNEVEFMSALDRMCISSKCLVAYRYKGDYSLSSYDGGHLTEAGSLFLWKNN